MNPTIRKIFNWWRLRKARKLALRYGLDFTHSCVFDEQLNLPIRHLMRGGLVLIPMKSGRKAYYKGIITSHYPGNTGQKDWLFEFQGYQEEPTCRN